MAFSNQTLGCAMIVVIKHKTSVGGLIKIMLKNMTVKAIWFETSKNR